MRTLGSLVGVALALTLVACGSDDDTPPGGGGGPTGGRNEADEVFVQVASGSTGTLRQIVALAQEQSDSSEVVDLADEIDDVLGEVRDQLETWEDDWDLPQEVYGAAPGLAQQEQSEDWQRLETLEGEEFDELWVEVVSDSLAAVRSSAETVVERGSDPDVRTLADDLAKDCANWISELQELQV